MYSLWTGSQNESRVRPSLEHVGGKGGHSGSTRPHLVRRDWHHRTIHMSPPSSGGQDLQCFTPCGFFVLPIHVLEYLYPEVPDIVFRGLSRGTQVIPDNVVWSRAGHNDCCWVVTGRWRGAEASKPGRVLWPWAVELQSSVCVCRTGSRGRRSEVCKCPLWSFNDAGGAGIEEHT
jgi:hypothetical protein